MAISFPLFPLIFGISINIHEYGYEIISFMPMTSINLSYDITRPITKCHNDSLCLKLVYIWMFNRVPTESIK